MHANNRETQQTMTPQKALQYLANGNQRFVENLRVNRNLLQQVNDTAEGQWPFAAILSCIDSRTSAELIFDQGLGDIFSIRIAGNVLNDDILGSMEFACKVAGSKLIVVLGHTRCGAIVGACDGIEMGHATGLLAKIKPAIKAEKTFTENRNGSNFDFVNTVATHNVLLTLEQIRQRSPILAEMEASGDIMLAAGMYDIQTGQVTFLEVPEAVPAVAITA